MDTIKKVCFIVCLICLAAGVLVSILAVWGAVGGDAIWKMLTTFAIIFAGGVGLDVICSFYLKPPK
jgi:4-hydroxybenzoate polyprenyltransferase